MDIENFEYDPSKDRSYVVNANWALYVDNYLEGFHVPFVHKKLSGKINIKSYKTELLNNGVLQYTNDKNNAAGIKFFLKV